VVFDYGVFPTADVLERWGVTVHSLATWQVVLVATRCDGLVDERSLNELDAYLKDPGRLVSRAWRNRLDSTLSLPGKHARKEVFTRNIFWGNALC